MRKRHPFLWQATLCAAAIVTAIPMVAVQMQDLRLACKFRDMWGSDYPDSYLPDGLTLTEKLVAGDPPNPMVEEREALYLSDRENPAFYAEYAQTYLREFGKLPEHCIETVSRIAPRNSFFLFLAAAEIDFATIGCETAFPPIPFIFPPPTASHSGTTYTAGGHGSI
jgi:hypothetical protein